MRHTTNLHIITKEETSQTFDISELMEMQKNLIDALVIRVMTN